MRSTLTILTISLFLGSCSAEWHIKKAIAKDPSILEKDTIIFTDSVHVVTKEVHTDSVFQVSKDTVTIVKDNLTIKTYHWRDSVYIYGECASDTVIRWKTYEVPTEKVVFNESWWPRWMWWIVALIIALFILRKLFPSFFK